MVTVICSICGEPVGAESQACPACEGRDLRALRADQIPPTAEERLIANAHRTVEKISELHNARALQLDEDSKARTVRALKARAKGQVGVIEARLRDQQERLHEEQERVDTTAYHAELGRLKRELLALL